ncbi:hypothetical protein CANINC_002477 [Pichia inconspicua]|uniref:SH3 domain-containing protein n=1 Tax=Pichia inconspicua TaxID=52247 RepID=A0A4T0X2U1_9ASCO|nr:hypothetical protein CANINC_002477 [[Candida] inconspicua]
MDSTQLARVSRKDLLNLKLQAGTGRDKRRGLEDNNEDNDEEEEDFDNDFSLHDLKNLALSSPSHAKDDDLVSNTSSSAASTVIHNPHLKSDEETKHLQLHDLNTLESDPDLHNKLHRTLKLSNLNSQINEDTNDNSKTDNTINDTLDDGNDTINGIIDELNRFDDTDDSNIMKLQDNDKSPTEEENSSNDSINMVVEDLTDDKLLDFIDGMLPSPPSSPPRELDPSKLYALYDFTGPDPSHLPLSKNDSVHLLNDSDSYWWLVRKDDNNRIGFAPAELLETYTERLARLNCWKNEVLERGGIKGLRHEEERKLFKSEHPPSLTNLLGSSNVSLQNNLERKGSLKKPKFGSGEDLFEDNKKTVSFADIHEFQEHSVLSESESIEDGSMQLNNSSLSLLNNYDNDENNEFHKVISNDDSQSTNHLMVPKTRRKNFLIKDLDTYVDPIENEEERSSTSPISSANDDVNSLISTPTKDQDHNITVSTCGSTESVDQTTNIKPLHVKKIRKYHDNNKTISSPMPSKRKDSPDTQEHRLASLKMLDDLLDMYPEFANIQGSSPSAENSPQKEKLGEGYHSSRNNLKDKLFDTVSTSPLRTSVPIELGSIEFSDVNNTTNDNLHPSTQRIFTPLFSTIEKLDQMVSDLQHL